MSNFSKGFGSVLSRFIGWSSRLRSPASFVRLAQKIFIWKYSLELKDCVVPKEGYYDCVASLFTRELKPSTRPLAAEPIASVDGTLREIQVSQYEYGLLTQVKGIEYTVSELTSGRATSGVVANMYLSPKDYHHVHSPISGVIEEIAFVPGAMWPVNNLALKYVPKLFCTNERAIFTIVSPQFGKIIAVMVAALNVGDIKTPWGDAPRDIASNEFVIQPNAQINAGDKIGTFALGSSLLVVFPRDRFDVSDLLPGPITLGETLLNRGLKIRDTST